MAYGRRYGRRSRSFASGGTRFGGNGAIEIRRHVGEIKGKIEAGHTRILPVLYPTNSAESTSTTLPNSLAETTKVYPTGQVPIGSRVSDGMKMTLQVKPTIPTDVDNLDWYFGNITTSFHDLKSEEILGMGITANHIPVWKEIDGTETGIGNAMSHKIAMTQPVYDSTDTLKHWWRGLRKLNQIQQGQIPTMRKYWKFPPKVKRMNKGTFYGFLFMNDSDKELSIEFDYKFEEYPRLAVAT